MIYSLNGELILADALSGTAVIECAGVGYKTTISANTLTKLPPITDKPPRVRLLTHMQVREDAVELFGFSTEEELTMFRALISVSGVGPKAAISILSLMTPQKLARAVGAEDAKAIAKAPGVGAKTAARIILELKSKFAKSYPTPADDDTELTLAAIPAAPAKGKLADAQAALLVLGYSKAEITSVLKNADTSAPLESIIRAALTALMKQ